MGVPVTREFTAGEPTRIWEPLNEIKGWIDELGAGSSTAPIELGTQDLNTLTDGTYSQASGAEATVATHYPVEGGCLVLRQWSWGARKAQLAILTGTTRVFARTFTTDTWTPWLELVAGPRFAAGTVVVDMSSKVSGSAVVALPAGRFTQPPIATCVLFRGSDGSASMMVPRVSSRTATQFVITVTNVTNTAAPSGTTAEVHWTAVQMSDAAAAG